jgi:hypothetical protein
MVLDAVNSISSRPPIQIIHSVLIFINILFGNSRTKNQIKKRERINPRKLTENTSAIIEVPAQE